MHLHILFVHLLLSATIAPTLSELPNSLSEEIHELSMGAESGPAEGKLFKNAMREKILTISFHELQCEI